ncbi:hypothetical protein LguiA_007074 [Lonicera macranthoides]
MESWTGSQYKKTEEQQIRRTGPTTDPACLIADIVQHFVNAKLDFDAGYVYQDVNCAIQHVHQSGLVHRGILSDP